jgi:hypothetical protein
VVPDLHLSSVLDLHCGFMLLVVVLVLVLLHLHWSCHRLQCTPH